MDMSFIMSGLIERILVIHTPCGHACSPMKGLDHVVTIGVTHVVAWHRSSHVYNHTYTLLLAY